MTGKQTPFNSSSNKPSPPIIIQQNNAIITYARASLSSVAGAAAGILGLRGWVAGLAFYIGNSLLLSLCLHLSLIVFSNTQSTSSVSSKSTSAPTTTKRRTLGSTYQLYFPAGSPAVWTHQVSGGISSYLLFWTLVHGLVYIYD